jgi:hypothetical protein
VITISGSNIDAPRGVRGVRGERGIKVYPPSKIFAILVKKNAIKHQKGVPSTKNFHSPYIPFLPKLGKNLMDPPSGISNHVYLWAAVTSKEVFVFAKCRY